jgi:hypothetical protein
MNLGVLSFGRRQQILSTETGKTTSEAHQI